MKPQYLTRAVLEEAARLIRCGHRSYACYAVRFASLKYEAVAELEIYLKRDGIPTDGSWCVDKYGGRKHGWQEVKAKWLLALADELYPPIDKPAWDVDRYVWPGCVPGYVPLGPQGCTRTQL